MSRVIDSQTNPWGRNEGVEVQRSDFWVVDFHNALKSLSTSLLEAEAMSTGVNRPRLPAKLQPYFAQSVTLPELKVRSEPIRRDSMAYPTPSWDEALEPIAMTFILDSYTGGELGTANKSPYQSDIYLMLDGWRAVVRAGRGSQSNEYALRLNADYRIDYRFDVGVLLLRGCSSPKSVGAYAQASQQALLSGSALAGRFGFSNVQTVGNVLASASVAPGSSIVTDLEWSSKFNLVNCWLGGFKIGELNYDAAKVVTLTATFYADDILQVPTNNA